MSIKTEIARLTGAKEDIMDALSAKGAALDGDERLDDLPSVISSIPSRAPDVTQATPVITVSSGGLISASAEQAAGTVAAGTKSTTKQLTTQAAKTVTPTTSDQTAVASGRYTTGAVTVKGDANLKAENIAKGVSIFGVTGAHEGGGGGGGVETCTVTVTASGGNLSCLGYTSAGSGQTEAVFISDADPNTQTLSNVVCGSIVAVVLNNSNLSNPLAGVGTELMGGYMGSSPTILCYKVTASVGASATIKT